MMMMRNYKLRPDSQQIHTAQVFSYIIRELLRELLECTFHKDAMMRSSTAVPFNHPSILN